MIVLATDGAVSRNGYADCSGGWAGIITIPSMGEWTLCGGDYGAHVTNNRMEMMAALVPLATLPDGAPVQLISDSAYVIKAIEQKWIPKWRSRDWFASSGKPVANRDLWEQMDRQIQRLRISPSLVKGHSGHELNERCDALAVQAKAISLRDKVDWTYPGIPA